MVKFAFLALAVGALMLMGCDDEDEMETTPGTSPEQSTNAKAAAAPTSDTVDVRDPVEDAFTVKMPKGWHNRAYSARAYDIHRPVTISVSPNGDTLLFRGDPSIPNYYTPQGANPMTYEFAKVNPLIKVEPYRPVTAFLPDYVRRKFGKLENFQAGEVQLLPETEAKMAEAFRNAGFQIEASCGKIPITFEDKGKKMNAIIYIYLANTGAFFTVEVSGISTSGNPADFEAMLDSIRNNTKVNPAWTQKQNELHQQRIAQIQAATEAMTARHNQNMAWIQNSAARHQDRMKALWAQSDASMNAYWERSAASDLSHQRFLNYINDEHTVVNSSGKTFQVDSSYDTYFMNKHNGTYVGGQATWDVEKLRSLGLDPSDYEQVQIRR